MSSHPLQRILKKKERTVIGLMSGTSTDGIDAVLVKITGCGISTRFRVIAFDTIAYSPAVINKLLSVQDKPAVSLQEISRLHFALGELFAHAVLRLAKKAGFPINKIDLVGSHGHTIAHYPKPKSIAGITTGATLQIGDPGVIARRTGIVTVGDFRSADIAAGGEGAPLVPYFDYLIFRSETECRGMLNIGGISNLTILPAGCTEKDVLAYDCGPGNMLSDYLMRKFYKKRFDRNGETAARGNVSGRLMRRLLAHPFLKRKPPRSTGREEYGPHYSERISGWAEKLKLPKEDVMATVSSYTAEAVARSYRLYVKPRLKLDTVIAGGGGAHNSFIMRELARLLPEIKIEMASNYGISPDSKEAVAFAVLANETISGNPGNMKNATGAREEVVLGKICIP